MSGRDVASVVGNAASAQGDLNNQIRDSLRELDKVNKAYEKIQAKIQASNELNKDVTTYTHKNLLNV